MNLLQTRLAMEDFILEMVRIPPQELKLEQLQDWVARLNLRDELLQQHIGFCSQSYTRRLICRTPRFDMLVLGWWPGQVTPIHDHAGSLNVTRVYSGTLTSKLFELYQPADNQSRLLKCTQEDFLTKDELVQVDRGEIHQLANTSDQPLVTLHVYARPLQELTVYNPTSGQAERVPVHYGLEADCA